MKHLVLFLTVVFMYSYAYGEIAVSPEHEPYSLVTATTDVDENGVWHVFDEDFEPVEYSISQMRECVFTGPPGEYLMVNGPDYATTVIKGTAPVPPDDPDVPDVPDVPDPPEGFVAKVKWLGDNVPAKYKDKMPAVGDNYTAVAAQAAATSGWSAVKMINAVKVRNLEVLGADGAADLRDTFFAGLALEMAKQGLDRNDLKGHIKMFNDIGKALGD